MKTLLYLNLATHIESWPVLFLKVILKKIILHGLYLKLQLTLCALRNISCELWLVLDALNMVLHGHPGIVPRILCLYSRTLEHVMEIGGSFSDSPPSNSGSHILKTLDDG
jgi:hypothetical protein